MGGVALGNLTESASGPSGTVSSEAPPARSSRRADRYALHGVIADLLPGERVCQCGTRAVPGKEPALKVAPDGGAFYGNVRACGSVWLCPYCAAKVGRARSVELRRAVDAARALGLVVTLATFTVGHRRTDDLRGLVDQLAEGLRWWRSGRQWQAFAKHVGYVGSVRNLEVTWGERTGWHPHSHALLFTTRALSNDDRAALGARWSAAVARFGGYASADVGLQLTDADQAVAGYLSKQERELLADVPGATDERRGWGAAEELTYWHTKAARGDRLTPWALVRGLMATGWAEYADRFVEYAVAFHGRRQLYWSKGLREILELGAEASDQEVADAEGEAETVFVFDRVEWLALVRSGLRWDALAAFEAGGLGAFLDVVAQAVAGPTPSWLPWEWWGDEAGE